MKIVKVNKDGVGHELGIKVGDKLKGFDNNPATDILDYQFFDGETDFVMTIEDSSGQETDYEIEKDIYETLGLEFDAELSPMSCHNNCVFCFVDQLPKGSRDALNVKDDDYRMSFAMGNYITLTNLTQKDFDRIVRLKLSPLYVSVHSTDDAVRQRMLRCKKKLPSIMDSLRYLRDNGIIFHTQIVYCPTFNDDYIRSAKDLSAVAESLAIVPVGITKYCKNPLKPVDKAIARKVIADIVPLQDEFLKARGDRFVCLADEFYIKAHMNIPPYEHYGNFDQIENGVGLIAKLEQEAKVVACDNSPPKNGNYITIATSVSAYDTIKRIVDGLGKHITVIPIINKYFGESVTVAGLITGQDLAEQLAGKVRGRLLLPRCMLKEGGDIFLDDMSLTELKDKLGADIQVVDVDGESLVRSVLNNTKNR
ncbi:MAG: DUF512 domain-containing protein [Firmicutes bacterium]|nr:DUF512 domain-containing protein [Bacillota bacterium]